MPVAGVEYYACNGLGRAMGAFPDACPAQGICTGDWDVAMPFSAIDHVCGDNVCLKLDKDGIRAFPTIPVKRNSTDLQG